MPRSTNPNKPLRYGFTTGACATAATKAALETLITGMAPHDVMVQLPNGKGVCFQVKMVERSHDSVTSAVKKDAGDDPDITNGMDILSTVRLNHQTPAEQVLFIQGEGVGQITIDGHELQKGEPAINPVPRKMIQSHVAEVLNTHSLRCGVDVILSVPGGKEIARRTLNPRLGIEGGISILGTSGIVVPYSEEAYLESIHQSIQIAFKNGCSTLVLNSGSKSEAVLKQALAHLPELCFVHYGNWIRKALLCAAKATECREIVAGAMLAKATKLAAGHFETSSRQVAVDKSFIADMAKEAGYSGEVCHKITQLTLVRGIADLIPFNQNEPFYQLLAKTCYEVCRRITGNKRLTFYLMNLSGEWVRYPNI